jgi:hypothetical protein
MNCKFPTLLIFCLLAGCNNSTDETLPMDDLPPLVFDGQFFWTVIHKEPWFDGEFQLSVNAPESGMSKQQINAVNIARQALPNLDGLLQEYVAEHYRQEVYGTIAGFEGDRELSTDEVTPPVTNSRQIWGLLSEPAYINIPKDGDVTKDCCFAIAFECKWDPEHGISVLFNHNGHPVAIGGQCTHFD